MKRILDRFRSGSSGPESVKSFDESRRIEEAYDSRYRGIRTVPIERIVGSVGRYQDFDERFRLKEGRQSERLENVKKAIAEGKPLPPVKLYQIKDAYYVMDGNHRIAVAKELGHDEILAQIVEFIPSANTLENVLYRDRAAFYDKTGLSADIELTEVGQYEYLLDQIENHRVHLERQEGRAVTVAEAASDWHRTIYRPLCAIIRRGRLPDSFPERTQGDFYVYITRHQWEENRRRRYGIGIDRLIFKNMEEFRERMANVDGVDYPEMKRGITAFILMNVQAKRELRIMEKLFALDAVREIHSVHGDADFLVKVELTRDLLSSDAEIISQFVHEHVRQIPGVNSTKTLIPGFSKVK
ncbi:MAG: Lrp/AsnC ligand binding domain-containing protein [Desulfobacteraceae bacterium]|nr:Lrp/AsnC ligand binding domain-containing protein [Desulfobacteraceae bacterium]